MLYQQDNLQAFEELYRRHSGRLYGFLKAKMREPGDAEDLLQLTLLRLHQNRAQYDASMPFLPWIFSIARHLIIDHVRKHRAIPVEDNKLIGLADRHQTTANDKAATWDEVMELLPNDQRKLLELRFEEGLSFEEIAANGDVTAQSARKRVSRTLQRVRNVLGGKKA